MSILKPQSNHTFDFWDVEEVWTFYLCTVYLPLTTYNSENLSEKHWLLSQKIYIRHLDSNKKQACNEKKTILNKKKYRYIMI